MNYSMQSLPNRVTVGYAALARVCVVVLLTAIPLAGEIRSQELPDFNIEHPIVPADYEEMPMVGSAIQSEVLDEGYVGCPSCGSSLCDGCSDFVPGYACPPGVGLWLRADYLMVWEKSTNSIPLITTSVGIPDDPGALLSLRADETRILFGNQEYDSNSLDGWRLEIGTWLDATATTGIMGRYFEVTGRDIAFSADQSEFGFLGVPFHDDASDMEEAFTVAVPDELIGSAGVSITGGVKGFELLLRRVAQTGCNYRMDWLVGYRNFQLDENLHLRAGNLDIGSGLNPIGTTIRFNDEFDVENKFHGLDLGVTGHSHEGMWSMDFIAKVALGSMNQEININGTQTTQVPPSFEFANIGGLFSQESNIGSHDQSKFAVIPEININIGYALTSNLDFTFGYTWMYASDVIRAASSIDRVVHSGYFGDLNPDSDRPGVKFDETSYWLQALNFGVTGRF